jgi:hypothetical protein
MQGEVTLDASLLTLPEIQRNMSRGILPEMLNVYHFITHSSDHVEISEKQFHFLLRLNVTEYPHLQHVPSSSLF